MTRIAYLVTSAREMTLADGTAHPTGYFAEEALKPYERFAAAAASARCDGFLLKCCPFRRPPAHPLPHQHAPRAAAAPWLRARRVCRRFWGKR